MRRNITKYVSLLMVAAMVLGTASTDVYAKKNKSETVKYEQESVTVQSPSTLAVYSSTVSVDGIQYTLDSSSATACMTGLDNWTGSNLDVSSITVGDMEYKVTSVANGVFRNNLNLTSIHMPEVETISDWAFWGCTNLTDVTMEKVLSMGMYVFGNCTSLIQVSMPMVQAFGRNAFEGCKNMQTVSFPELSSISDNMFLNCNALKNVDLPRVTTMGDNTFAYCNKLTQISLPEVTNIGVSAFDQCISLISVSMPKVTTIAYGAFSYCNKLQDVQLPVATTIKEWAFRGCESLESVDLPMVTSISTQAFRDCTILHSINMPAIQSLADYTFLRCKALDRITIPETLKTMGAQVFSGCDRLSRVTLLSTGNIDNNAFAGVNATFLYLDQKWVERSDCPVREGVNYTFKGGNFTSIGYMVEQDSSQEPIVDVDTPTMQEENVTLSEGTYKLYLNDVFAGIYSFENEKGGWMIKDSKGYLTVVDGTLQHTAEPSLWKYKKGGFTQKWKANVKGAAGKMQEYYMASDDALSTKPVEAELRKEVK